MIPQIMGFLVRVLAPAIRAGVSMPTAMLMWLILSVIVLVKRGLR